jgi:site-specific DNA-cytosine methylase
MFTFINLYSGCGGLSSGFVQSGFEPLLLVEPDLNSSQTLRANKVGFSVIKRDPSKVKFRHLFNKVDVVSGS